MLLNVLSYFVPECYLIPVEVERYHRVDWVAEFGHFKEGVDQIEYSRVGRVRSPVPVEDAVADSTVPVDIRMVDRCMETALWRECRIVAFHI